MDLPIPPLPLRQSVGPTDISAYDNPSGAILVPGFSTGAVFDFGCGCGRMARQLIQQDPQPERYLGIDLCEPLARWCALNLGVFAPQFQFRHHDVFNPVRNPESRQITAPFPAGDQEFDLVLAHSVFTHITGNAVMHYLRECARVLKPTGIVQSTWFLFDKGNFPMMPDHLNSLYIDCDDPTAAVLFDRRWFVRAMAEAGLVVWQVIPPQIRGYHWSIILRPVTSGAESRELPDDEAPLGSVAPGGWGVATGESEPVP